MPQKPVLLVTRKMPPAVEQRAARDYAALLNPDDSIYDAEALAKAAAGADGLLIATEAFPADRLAMLPKRVRIIACFTAGFEHVDVAAARARGIAVSNAPDALTEATAEIAMLLLLGAARRGAEGDALVRGGGWNNWHVLFMAGTGLAGKRLGILGMGRIGRAVAKRARAFGMAIHYHNRTRLPADLEADAVWHDDPEDLLGAADFLSLHCPLTDETRGFLNAARIARLPAGAIVVNTARGDVVDDEALVAALRAGHVRAAGLDVFRGEPRNIHPGYAALPNTFLLPHLGSATLEARTGMGLQALDNLDAFFAGRPLPNPVN